MKERRVAKCVKLNIRITAESHVRLQEAFGKTTFRVFTDYLRALLEKEPVTFYFRNRSLDEFLEAAYAMKEELYTAGRNFDRAVKALKAFPEGAAPGEALDLVLAAEFDVRRQVSEIKDLLTKIYDKCLP